MTIQHILVLTDFSAYAEQVLDYAIALAKRLQARVTLIHVIFLVFWGTGEATAVPPPTYFEDVEANAQQGIEEALKHVRTAGLAGQTMVVYGVPFERIITVARDNGITGLRLPFLSRGMSKNDAIHVAGSVGGALEVGPGPEATERPDLQPLWGDTV